MFLPNQTNYNDEEEYYYDDNDFTVKPITLNPPTSTTIWPTTPITSANSEPAVETHPTTYKIDNMPPVKSTTPQSLNAADETTSDIHKKEDDTTPLTSSLLWNTLSSLISKRPSKEEIGMTPPSLTTKTTKKQSANNDEDIMPRSKIEPIYAIHETNLQATSKDGSATLNRDAKPLTNSKIYKVKLHRSHQPQRYTPLKMQSRRCRSNQYRDLSGNCRIKRSPGSASLL